MAMFNPTAEQLQVYEFVKNESAHGIIDAVAGSGKTTTIVESAYFIDRGKTVLFCAFNRSIAREIQRRFTEKGLTHIEVSTIHRLGYNILKSHSPTPLVLKEKKYNEIIDKAMREDEFASILTRLCALNDIAFEPKNDMEKAQLKKFMWSFRSTLLDINNKFRLTLTKMEIGDFKKLVTHFNIFIPAKLISPLFQKEVECYFEANKIILERGNEIAKRLSELDFSDMLYLPYKDQLFPASKFDIVFVDECQDLSKSQLAVVMKHVKKEGRILSVGDPYQSIYGFTGADIESFNRIRDLPNTVTLTLSKCFRCPDKVIEMARNYRSDIESFVKKDGVIETIRFLEVIEKVQPKNLVICRTKAPLLSLMFLLLERNIEIAVHEDDIKDLLNELRFLFTAQELNERDLYKNSNDFYEKVKQRNIYFIEKDAKKIQDINQREQFIEEGTHMVNEKIDFIIKQQSIHTKTYTIHDLLNKIETLVKGGPDAVKLSTIHRAKGLENDVIFILDYDKLPLKRKGQKEWEIVQENNLLYVALTRTKSKLYLVTSEDSEPDADDASLFDALDDLW